MRAPRIFQGKLIWAAPVEETTFEVDGTMHKIGITVFDYGNALEHIMLDHFIIADRERRTFAHSGVLTPLLDHMRKDLFKDLRRELPDNRSAEKQRLLIAKAMQELM